MKCDGIITLLERRKLLDDEERHFLLRYYSTF